MFDTLTIIPFWGVVLFYVALGAGVGVVQARRRYSRSVGIGLLLAITFLVAGVSATRWDWKTRATPLGSSADSELRYSLEAQGTARGYQDARGRWVAMNGAARWSWRMTMFGIVSASLLGGGVPTFLWMTRASAVDRGSRRRADATRR